MPRARHRVVNAAAVHMPRKAEGIVRAALSKKGRKKRGGKRHLPDVVHLSEVSPVDVQKVAVELAEELGDEYAYDVIQLGEIGSPEAGVALAVRRKTMRIHGQPKMAVGSRGTSEGGGIRMRPITSTRVSSRRGRGSRRYPAAATHTPPGRAPESQDDYNDEMRDTRGVVGGDKNTRLKRLRRMFSGRAVRGIGVLALLIPRWIMASKAFAIDVGSDHMGFDVDLWIPPKVRHAVARR